MTQGPSLGVVESGLVGADHLLGAPARFLASVRGRRGTGAAIITEASVILRLSVPMAWHAGCTGGGGQATKGRRDDQESFRAAAVDGGIGGRGAVVRRRSRQGQAQDGRGRALAVLHSDVCRAVERLRRRRGARGRDDHRQWRRPRRRVAPLRPDRVRARRPRSAGLHLQRRVPGQAGDLLRATATDGLFLASRQQLDKFDWSMLNGKKIMGWRPGSTPSSISNMCSSSAASPLTPSRASSPISACRRATGPSSPAG